MTKKINNIILAICLAYIAYQIYSIESGISAIEQKMQYLKCNKDKCYMK